MRVAQVYSHKDALSCIPPKYIKEIVKVIESIQASEHRTKKSKEKERDGNMLLSPRSINKSIKRNLECLGWESQKIKLETPMPQTEEIYKGFREIDFVKQRIGVEVQFGKYAFFVYDVLCKMVIFNQKNLIDYGISIRPTRKMASDMSTGIGHFEMAVSDLYHRGEADIDIPVLTLGIEP